MDSIIEWIRHGVNKGWVGVPQCYTHDDILTPEESEEIFIEDNDVCIPLLRVLVDIPWSEDEPAA